MAEVIHDVGQIINAVGAIGFSVAGLWQWSFKNNESRATLYLVLALWFATPLVPRS